MSEPIPLDYGWRIRETANYFIDVVEMGYNRRICLVPKSHPYEIARGWCYSRPVDLLLLRLRAYAFDPEAGEEPTGWVKEPGTERRACAAYHRSQLQAHDGYDPDCPDCGNESLA